MGQLEPAIYNLMCTDIHVYMIHGAARACDSNRHVVRHLDRGAGASLGEAVPLHEGAIERGTHPLLHFSRDGTATREAGLEVAAGRLLPHGSQDITINAPHLFLVLIHKSSQHNLQQVQIGEPLLDY